MAMTASAMAYSWSKWNGERDKGEIVFQGAEALEDEPLLEDWSLYLATKRRVTKLKMTEFDEAFEEDTGMLTVGGSTGKFSKTSSTPDEDGTVKTGLPLAVSSKLSWKGSKASRKMSGTHREKKGQKHREDCYVDPLYEIYSRDSPFKSNMHHLMKELGTEAALTRIQDTNFQFVDCVHQLLKATKVLTYA